MNEPRLLQGDCLERMAEIEDGSVDLIAADLPYGVTCCRWDQVIPFETMWATFKRVLKPKGAVVLTASQPFTSMLVMSNPRWFRWEDIWEKDRPTGTLDANRRPMRAHENLLVFAPVSPTYNPQFTVGLAPTNGAGRRGRKSDVYRGRVDGKADTEGRRYPRSVVRFNVPNNGERGFHPTQKPVALMEYLIRTYSNEGETVLDPTFGSCTTGVACYNTGREFIGIERDPVIFETGRKRLADLMASMPLLAAGS